MLERDTQSTSPIIRVCQPLLDRCTDRILAYLQADRDHPRQWLPDESGHPPRWTADEDAELRDLHIPGLPTPKNPPYGPDLVLYRVGELETLDSGFSERLASVSNSDSHSLVVNTSGTGKTRLLLEILSRSWGFYFACSMDHVSSPYGSMDMPEVFNLLPAVSLEGRLLKRRLVLHGPGSRASRDDLARNRRIAHWPIYCVLLSRLLIFNHFCTLAATLGLSDELLRRRWLLLQLRPHEFLGKDVFCMLSGDLLAFPPDLILAETRTAFAIYGQRLQFVALDEAQVASLSFTRAFALSDDKSYAPILREIVRCMATAFPQQRLLVAGTEAELGTVSDAISDISSPFSGFTHVYDLGSFDAVQKTTTYLRHFLGETFTDEDCAEVHSLFQGRHRFLTVFVENVLKHGYRDMDTVMNSLQQLLTGYSRPGSDHFRLPYALIIEDEWLDGCWFARQATFRFLLTREPTILSDEAASVVALGLGLFCDPKASAIMFEPLVFYRLAGWLLESSYSDIGGRIRHRLRDPNAFVRGIDISAGLASYLWPMFSGSGRELSDGLAFEGPAPFWCSHRARLVLPALLTCAAADPDAPAEHSITVAREPGEVFQWLRTGRCAFLIPDAAFGADLLFCLHVEGVGALLVTVFTEPFDTERSRRTSTVSPKNASSFYAHSRENQEILLSILREGPARPFDLGSKRRKPQPLRLNMLRVLCFARAAEPVKPYNPPVAVLDMNALLKLKHAPELSFSTLDDIVWGAFT